MEALHQPLEVALDGTVKVTAIGWTWLTLMMPVVRPVVTMLPGSTSRTPTRPAIGEGMRHHLTLTLAAACTLPWSARTVPSSCLTVAAWSSAVWRAMESWPTRVW